MSDEQQGAAKGEVAPVAPPVVTPPATPPASDPSKEPDWLPARLERERKALLKSLGIESEDDAKKALTDYKAKQDAEKTEAQRNAEKLAELDRVKARAGSLEEIVNMRASDEMGKLTDAQKAAVKMIAGDDAAAQLKAITALGPTWASAPAAPVATPPVATPLANTGPAPSAAPAPTQVTSPPDHKAVYLGLKKTNPIAAAHYLDRHSRQIFPES